MHLAHGLIGGSCYDTETGYAASNVIKAGHIEHQLTGHGGQTAITVTGIISAKHPQDAQALPLHDDAHAYQRYYNDCAHAHELPCEYVSNHHGYG